MLNILNNLGLTYTNKRGFKETYSISTYLYFYRFFYNWFNLNFFKYFEFFFILNRFNTYSGVSFNILFIYLLTINKIANINIKYFSVLNNNSLIYFFNQTIFTLNKTIYSVKTHLQIRIIMLKQSKYKIRYSSTSVVKYLHNSYLSLLNILFLRKNKIFNKGRYSRNRQFYRTGVYWCLYINIIAMIGLYFWFYRFVINFSYLWWLFYFSLASFIIAKCFNYNLLNISNFINSIYLDLIFFKTVVINLYNYIKTIVILLIFKLNRFSIIDFTLINQYKEFFSWFFLGLAPFFYKHPFIYIWNYNNINYYIYSITQNYNRVWLDSKKNKIYYEFVNMLTKK